MAAIWAIVGPLLVGLLKNLIESLLKRAEKKAQSTDPAKIIQTALDMTPRIRFRQRALLRHMLITVPPAIKAGKTKLAKSDAAEMMGLAGVAEEEAP